MHFRLAETGREGGVEVRVKDQAGELRVAVRTPDGELTKSLREGLPELVERLGQHGYETQVWRPAGTGSPTEPRGAGAALHETDPGGGAGDQRRSGPDQSGSGDRGSPNHEHESRAWSDEWRASLGAPREP